MILKLTKYFTNKVLHYRFFTALLHEEKSSDIKISDILDKNKISDSAFRKEMSTNKPSEYTINKLLSYFGYYPLNLVMQNDYEFCIQKIYINSFIRKIDSLNKYMNKLEQYINDNNYLKPLFILFKVFGYLNLNYPIDLLKIRLSQELRYLSEFYKKDYFIEEYELIYLTILYYFNIQNDNKIEFLVKKYRNYSWMYNNLKASRYYSELKFSYAINYYDKVYKLCKEMDNNERAFAALVGKACCYNNIKEYDLCLELVGDIEYYIFSDKEDKWLKYIIQHYVHALFMLDQFDKIYRLINSSLFDIHKLTGPTAVEYLLVCRLLNKNELVDDIVELLKDNINVNTILKYIRVKNDLILDKLDDTVPFDQLKKKLKKYKKRL